MGWWVCVHACSGLTLIASFRVLQVCREYKTAVVTSTLSCCKMDYWQLMSI